MFAFMKCLAEAIAENGVRGLAEMVPGGKYACDVAELVWKKWRERRQRAEQIKELQEIANLSAEQAREVAKEAAAEVVSAAGISAEDAIDLEIYLSAVPDAVRQSFKRPDDPSGRSTPAGYMPRSATDVIKLLPSRPPRFRPGADLPGKSGWVLERPLGTGGFGEVWYTRHRKIAALQGAVKFCPSPRTSSPM
jgi:hypothetical protein